MPPVHKRELCECGLEGMSMNKMWRLLIFTIILIGCRDASGEEPRANRVVGRVHGTEFVVATGQFGAFMSLELVNSGPMTILLSSDSFA